MSIGTPSKKMRSEFIGLSSFLSFLVLYAKRGENNFFDDMERLLQLELHVLIRLE